MGRTDGCMDGRNDGCEVGCRLEGCLAGVQLTEPKKTEKKIPTIINTNLKLIIVSY